ncbi:MAG: hypothetical protein WBB28_14310 [Crinalium sp.]
MSNKYIFLRRSLFFTNQTCAKLLHLTISRKLQQILDKNIHICNTTTLRYTPLESLRDRIMSPKLVSVVSSVPTA